MQWQSVKQFTEKSWSIDTRIEKVRTANGIFVIDEFFAALRIALDKES